MKRFLILLLLLVACFATAMLAQAPAPAPKPIFKLQEVMIPVRDGVHLQTVIITPVDQQGPLPILFLRTPYGVPDKPPEQVSFLASVLKELAQDGYIFVFQNLRRNHSVDSCDRDRGIPLIGALGPSRT
jgi:uncharacterized protein